MSGRLENSLILAAATMAVMIPLSLALGLAAGTKAGQATDHLISDPALAIIGIPDFVVGSLLVIVVEATPEQMTLAAGRIKKAVRRSMKDASKEKTLVASLGRITLGTAAFPTHGTTRAALLARATASAESIARE